MKQKKNLWVNLLFAAVVLVIAGVLFYLRSAGQSGSTLGAELIYGDANTVQKISLDKDAVYDIDTGYLTVHIEVRDGAARFIDSPCPDHICESFGWISQEDQTATCLPMSSPQNPPPKRLPRARLPPKHLPRVKPAVNPPVEQKHLLSLCPRRSR